MSDITVQGRRFAVSYLLPYETAVSLDRSTVVAAVGTGLLVVGLERIVFEGTRRMISRGSIVMASCVSMSAAFLVAVMWQGERWPLSLLLIVAALLIAAGFLFKRRYRETPFRWDVPWKNVVAFNELETSNEWAVTLKGPEAGTVQFSVDTDSSGAFAELMVSLHETGLTKVRFAERVVPEARVVAQGTTTRGS
ncbi:MAG: hypothetical protein H0T42_22865 [Deltaproteobacteria bacterium]|nr:hypothetical protein [Deltaproteobacteria bacterium]